MRRLLLAAALLAPLVLPAHAAASTTTSVKMTFTEPTATPYVIGCPVAPQGFCGSGQVIPFGQATETIKFGAGCNGECDLRTVTLAGGSLIIAETFSDPLCPSGCSRDQLHGTLTDTVIGGTGMFADAEGNLGGSVHATTTQSVVKLSGVITY